MTTSVLIPVLVREGMVCALAEESTDPEPATVEVRVYDDAGEFEGAWPACLGHAPMPGTEGEDD